MKKQWLAGMLCALLLLFVGCSAPATNEEATPVNEEATTEEVAEEETSIDDQTPPEIVNLRIGTLKGPTGMGMSYLMEQDAMEKSGLDYTFDIVGAPDQLVGKIVKGDVDIAAVPTNLAAVLNVKTEGKIQLLGVNTLGVLYIVENGETIQSMADLEGMDIGASGKGATPEYVLNYLLAENDLVAGENVAVDYAFEHSELASTVAAGDTKVALLPQPFVTSVMLSNPDVRIAVDLNDVWAETNDTAKALPMGAIIVNKAYAEANPEVIATFMEEYKASVDFVNADPVEAGKLIEKFGIIPKAALATKAIPNCSITLIPAQDAKEDVLNFYEVLHSFNPKSIGGQLPSDEFFYE